MKHHGTMYHRNKELNTYMPTSENDSIEEVLFLFNNMEAIALILVETFLIISVIG